MDLERTKLEQNIRSAFDRMELARVQWLQAQRALFDYEINRLMDMRDANGPKL